MKPTALYLARVLDALETFQHTSFDSIEAQDAALTELLGLGAEIRDEIMRDNAQGVTTPEFWECSCYNSEKEDYKWIHYTGEKSKCPKCGLHHGDSPDTRLHVVLKAYKANNYKNLSE